MTSGYDTSWVPSEGAPQTANIWPEGNYEGEFVGGKFIASALKGTPGIELTFNVHDAQRSSTIWISENAGAPAFDQLQAVGWDGNVASPGFSKIGSMIPLYMKHEEYKGKLKEQWRVSTLGTRAAPSASDPVINKFAARFKALAPPSVNGTAPAKPAPAPAPAPAAPKAPPPKAPPKPKSPPKPRAATMDEAWAYWVECKCEDSELFYATIEKVAGHADSEKLPPEQWATVAASAPPF